jgi:ribosome maturation factor RimP
VTEDEVLELLSGSIAKLGLELQDVEWANGSLRLVVDQQGGVTADSLAEVNRLVSPILDQHNFGNSAYVLEVTSPGLERSLKKPKHFLQAIGKEIDLRAMPNFEHKRVKGLLTEAADESFTIAATEIDGRHYVDPENVVVPYEQVSKARTLFDWRAALKE